MDKNPVLEERTLRECRKCGSMRDIKEFRKKDGYVQRHCLECEREAGRKRYYRNRARYAERHRGWVKANIEKVNKQRNEYRAQNAEKLRERQREWRRKNIRLNVVLQSLKNAKIRCKKQNLPCTVTIKYLLDVLDRQNDRCALSGIKLSFATISRPIASSCSLDKINRRNGYVEGNVRFLCFAVNSFRGSMSDLEFQRFVLAIQWNWTKAH